MNKKLKRSHRHRNIIKCECGAEILLLPDVKAMGQAIEIHVAAVHVDKSKDSAGAAAEAARVRELLIIQVLTKSSEPENDES